MMGCSPFHRWIALAGLTLLALDVAVSAGEIQIQVAGADTDDAVVWLVPEGHSESVANPPLKDSRIEQKDYAFIPAVSVVPVGTEVDFPNFDKIRHHVYSFSEAKQFTLKLYVGSPAQPVHFDAPGIVVLGCNIHDSMIGFVIVVDTPWYGRITDGSVSFANMPDGDYRVFAWTPGMGGQALDAGLMTSSSNAPSEWVIDLANEAAATVVQR